MLTITENGGKLPQLFIFKSKKGGTIEKSLKNIKKLLMGMLLLNTMIMLGIPLILWKQRLYKKESPNGNGLVILDKCNSHIKGGFLKLLYDSNQIIV